MGIGRNLRVFYTVMANVVMGIGVTFLRLSGFGTDPFSCMNMGVSSHLPISYGTYQLLLNIVLFIPVFILDRKSFGLGALVNMLGMGYIIDFCTWLFSLVGVTPQVLEARLVIRIICMLVGVLLICFGVALYMGCDMGAAPYDMSGQIVEDRTAGKLKFKWVRVCMDICSMIIGFVTGGVVGVATIVVAFFTGPVVSWFRNHPVRRILKKDIAE